MAGLAGLPGHDACAQRPERRPTAHAPFRAAFLYPPHLPLASTAAGVAKAVLARALPRAPARSGGGVGVASVARVLGEHARRGCADNRCNCLRRCSCASGGQRQLRWAVCAAVCTTRAGAGSAAASAIHRAAAAAAASAASAIAASPANADAGNNSAATAGRLAPDPSTAIRLNNGSFRKNHAIKIYGGVRALGPRYISNHMKTLSLKKVVKKCTTWWGPPFQSALSSRTSPWYVTSYQLREAPMLK